MTGKIIVIDRRALLAGAAAAGGAGLLPRFVTPAIAQSSASGSLSPTETMPGGANNYIANAPLVQNLGTGFVASGVVRRAGNGAPLSNVRVQIWAATERGGERVPSNRGSVMTSRFRRSFPSSGSRTSISPMTIPALRRCSFDRS
jgi:hypothetical protein